VVDPAREHEVIERATPALQPRQEAGASGFEQFELHGPPRLLLDDDGTGADLAATDEFAGPQLDDVTAAQLTVDRKVEEGAVADPMLLIEPEPDGPDLLGFESALGA
jgi:hypothetical protein